ncbi:hypothetical protein [Schleiferilactobacillus harbinensis]|uniref:Uncharacterized protein n=1 Tax=Schleiferilactobacillus harbinensis TaxID=304207 RepID=A0A5P8M7W5_9LACO|nr:hypothetical protein [Schleiferilactobacillus harbinensis]QFR24618.1 hypothetical protein D1010_15240 [Schleiferilactobacillus harbinensis]
MHHSRKIVQKLGIALLLGIGVGTATFVSNADAAIVGHLPTSPAISQMTLFSLSLYLPIKSPGWSLN